MIILLQNVCHGKFMRAVFIFFEDPCKKLFIHPFSSQNFSRNVRFSRSQKRNKFPYGRFHYTGPLRKGTVLPERNRFSYASAAVFTHSMGVARISAMGYD